MAGFTAHTREGQHTPTIRESLNCPLTRPLEAPPMNLGDIITTLEAADPNQVVRHGFHNPHSYRGDYYDLAFEPAENITVADMLEAARSAVGATYEGWKGGEFRMTEADWCWLSEEGSASGETISPLLLEFMLTPPASQADVWNQAADEVARWYVDTEQAQRMRDAIAHRLRRKADEAQPDTEAHACRNCEGIDPDTCLMNPNRPPEQCPNSEFDGYGLQCQKPAGHNLCTFEEQPAAGARQDGAES